MINLRVLVPEATTNYVKNPSFRYNTTGWNVFGGTDTEVFEDNFVRANGGLGVPWEYTNSAWAISTNKAVGTPTLGAELFANGTFAVDASWTKGTGWTIGSNVATHASGTASNLSQAVGTVDRWIRVGFDIVSAAGSYFTALFGAATQIGSTSYTAPQTGIVITDRQVTAVTLGFRGNTTTAGSIDNATAKLITTSDLFATVGNLSTTANIMANAVITLDSAAGVVGWLDSYTSPANFIICYHDGENLKVDKCVAGVYTNLISAAATYVAGATIKLTGLISGSNLLVNAYYNGVQVGVQQTVSDAGIISNTRHGLFSTSELSSFSNIRIESVYTRTSLATLTRTLDRARFGIASGKVVTTGNMLYEGVYYEISWMNTINDIVTGSVYVRGAGTIRLRIADAASGANFISQPLALNDERWQRIEVTGRTSGTTALRLYVETADDTPKAVTFYIDGAQMERKAYATSYCDGDQDGCRWNIVEHSTISTRTADSRAGGRWVPLAGPCRPNNDIYVTVLGGMGMPSITNNVQSWSNSPGSFFQNEKIQNRVMTLSFFVKKEAMRTGGTPPSLSSLHELRQQLIDIMKPDLTLDSEAFLFEYSDTESDKPLYIRMRYEAGLEGEWDIRNRWYNSFPIRLLAVEPLWSEDSQDVLQLGISEARAGTASQYPSVWMRRDGLWQIVTNSPIYFFSSDTCHDIKQSQTGKIYLAMGDSSVASGRVEEYDGTSSTSIGASNSSVFCLAIGPDGTIYAGGGFTTIGGVACNGIAKMDPNTGVWSPLGTGLNGVVFSICIAPNGQIYVGGSFTTAGGITANYIARWDGLQWRTVGATSGVSAIVRTIINADDGVTLYFCGDFTTSAGGGITYNRVASVDITTNLISQLGDGFGAAVYSICLGMDKSLYAVGIPSSGSGDNALSRYSGGGKWLAVSGHFDNSVLVLKAGVNGEIYIGGQFEACADMELSGIAKWFSGNVNSMELIGNLISTTVVVEAILQSDNGDLYVSPGTGNSNIGAFYYIKYPKLNTITNNGTASCWPLMYIQGFGTVRYIANNKTGQEIFLDLPVFSGEEVEIDFARGKITSASRGDLSYTILPGSEIRSIFLLPGENTVSVLITDDVNAVAQLRWELQDWSADGVIDAESL